MSGCRSREAKLSVVFWGNCVYNKFRSRLFGRNGGLVMDAFREEKIYTIEDIFALPDGERAELVDGKIYYMAPPSRRHQDLIFSISRKIADYIDAKKGGCKVYLAPFAVFLDKNNQNYFEPDISVICDLSKLDEKGCHGAPDWIIEIVSPSSKQMEYLIKLLPYQTAGVREYWIVDPQKERVTVYFFEKENVEEYMFGEEIPVGIYEEFSIKIE